MQSQGLGASVTTTLHKPTKPTVAIVNETVTTLRVCFNGNGGGGEWW